MPKVSPSVNSRTEGREEKRIVPGGNEVRTYEYHGREPRQVQEFLTKIYAENEFRSTRKRERFKTDIRSRSHSDVGICNCSHAAPFSFESAAARHSILVVSCTAGSGMLRAGDAHIDISRGSYVPLSANGVIGILGEPALSHSAIHVNAERVNVLCGQWIGSQLDEPLTFDLTPFDSGFVMEWRRIVRALDALMTMEKPPAIALASLREHAIGALLERRPHNLSRFLTGQGTPSARVIREAAHLMEDRAEFPIGIGDIADAVGCSVRALHQGFREHARATPREFLYGVRLKRVREALTTETAADSVTEIAQRYGFVNPERFSTSYTEQYGEGPEETFRRHRGGPTWEMMEQLNSRGPSFSPEKAEVLRRFVLTNMGSRILVRSLAEKTGMSVQNFIVAFTKAFGITPAQYVIRERLRKALRMLANTNERISLIAAETGFASQSHLTTTLKSHEGLTPIQYRKLYRK